MELSIPASAHAKAWETSSISEVAPGIFIGNLKSTFSPDVLEENHITAVVSLIPDPLNLWRRDKFTKYAPKDRHMWVEVLDSASEDLLKYMESICDFIDRIFTTPPTPPGSDHEKFGDMRTRVPSEIPNNVLIHCDMGISRSGAATIAYLMRKQQRDLQSVSAEVKTKRPQVKPSANFMQQLEIWQQVKYQIWEDEARTRPKAEYKAFLEQRAAYLKSQGLTGDEGRRPMNLGDS